MLWCAVDYLSVAIGYLSVAIGYLSVVIGYLLHVIVMTGTLKYSPKTNDVIVSVSQKDPTKQNIFSSFSHIETSLRGSATFLLPNRHVSLSIDSSKAGLASGEMRHDISQLSTNLVFFFQSYGTVFFFSCHFSDSL